MTLRRVPPCLSASVSMDSLSLPTRYHESSPMRGTRWLLLVAIAAIITGLGITYRAQKEILKAQAPAKPEALPSNLTSKAQAYCYTQTNSNHTTVEVCADDMKELKDSSTVEVKNV